MMKRSTANPAMERSTGQKATGMARAQARSTWTGASGWASSLRGEAGLGPAGTSSGDPCGLSDGESWRFQVFSLR